MKRRMMILKAALVLLVAAAMVRFAHHSIAGKFYASAIIASQGDLENFFSAMGGDLTREQQNECVEITPAAVSEETDWRIFTLQNQYSFMLAGGEVHTLCCYWGGWGVTSALPWDYDKNGVIDLLYTYSWGSGMHRSHVSLFDMTAKKEIMLTTVYAENFDDAVVLPAEPDPPERFRVCLTDAPDSIDAPKQFVLRKWIGEVTLQEGQPVYTGCTGGQMTQN